MSNIKDILKKAEEILDDMEDEEIIEKGLYDYLRNRYNPQTESNPVSDINKKPQLPTDAQKPQMADKPEINEPDFKEDVKRQVPPVKQIPSERELTPKVPEGDVKKPVAPQANVGVDNAPVLQDNSFKIPPTFKDMNLIDGSVDRRPGYLKASYNRGGEVIDYHKVKIPDELKPLLVNQTPLIKHITNRLAKTWYEGLMNTNTKRFKSGDELKDTITATVKALRRYRGDEEFGRADDSDVFYTMRTLNNRVYNEMPKTEAGSLATVYDPEVVRMIKNSVTKHTKLTPDVKKGLFKDLENLKKIEMERDTARTTKKDGTETNEKFDKEFRLANSELIDKMFGEVQSIIDQSPEYTDAEYIKGAFNRAGRILFDKYIKPHAELATKEMIKLMDKTDDPNEKAVLDMAIRTREVLSYISNLFNDKYGATMNIAPSSVGTPSGIKSIAGKFGESPEHFHRKLESSNNLPEIFEFVKSGVKHNMEFFLPRDSEYLIVEKTKKK